MSGRPWSIDPLTIVLLSVSALVYAAGIRRAWHQASDRSAFPLWRVLCFGAGLVSVAIAQLSPLAGLSEALFSAHMTQHEILMLIAAPLLVLGHPLLAALWAVPARHRGSVAHRFRRPPISRAWRLLTAPATVFLIHAGALWIWHVPALFEGALAHEGIHFFQHMCFLLTAALFWWGMVYGRYGRIGYGVAVLYVFLTALHNTVLGALLAVSARAWYPSYELTAAARRIDAVADQQLAGLIMWVPSGVVFIVIGLALSAAWLGESERRALLGTTALQQSGSARRAP